MKIRINHNQIILLACIFMAMPLYAGSVRIVPEDTVNVAGGPWSIEPSCGGGNCRVSYITDGVDGNYIWSLSGLSQLYSFTNTSGIPGSATIDSFVVWFRCAVNNTSGSDRIRPRIRSTGSTNFCDGANMNIETTDFADSSHKFTVFTDGAGSCGGALTVARMDSLEIQILDVLGDTNKVTECSVVVWYTEMGSQLKARRRHLLSDNGGFEEFANCLGFDQNWVVRCKEEWIWRE